MGTDPATPGTGAVPPAGWYDDGTGKQRWWDGSRWTDEYIDLRDRSTELRTDAGQPATGVAGPGWFDDQRGRRRWWDGRQWTAAVQYSGEEQELAGIVIDGRWIHFGELSQPVAGVEASIEQGSTLLSRPAFTSSAVQRRLWGPGGAITSRRLTKAIERPRTYLVITGEEGVWVSPLGEQTVSRSREFATWVNSSAQHYRYR
ncbi:DUF2510 domain-containing protein [Microbacterium thalassium]|uniref:DUF2510 domain-containing protein n=1 Tax=Microbacterium thalassium TaxID=362649 RepID=A0A7X0KVW7_9MICO|nr:DUF2510 domain-containing protein [Microbacterium thalassium]MBB6392670.1 hypothetical protein [Microbacterium thalassium]